ncbi:MAG: hypothetical protein HC822_14495 [Oscillochloris sp.]|nr:hypothetical protein [Oscillochloris sp.]
MHQLALAQIAAILQRCPPGSPAQAEWLRRTRWTLELDFGRYAGPAAGP